MAVDVQTANSAHANMRVRHVMMFLPCEFLAVRVDRGSFRLGVGRAQAGKRGVSYAGLLSLAVQSFSKAVEGMVLVRLIRAFY